MDKEGGLSKSKSLKALLVYIYAELRLTKSAPQVSKVCTSEKVHLNIPYFWGKGGRPVLEETQVKAAYFGKLP